VSRRAVIDTNVLVSGLGWSGPAAAVLDAVADGRIELVLSSALLDELRRVLAYPRLATVLRSTGLTPSSLVDSIAAVSTVVTPVRAVTVARDADDNGLLEAAVAGDATMIISGDEDLLTLRMFEGIALVNPADALKRIEPKG
jgi:putative PIN family toxin of toxin-antitoxin system